MSKREDQAAEAINIMRKVREVEQSRSIALQRHQLQEAEFEALIQRKDAGAGQIEQSRLKMITLYEQYVDACLRFREVNFSAQEKIDQMIKGLNQ